MRFLKSQRTGFYFGIVEEGQVQAGDTLDLLTRHPDGLRVADVIRLFTDGSLLLFSKELGCPKVIAFFKHFIVFILNSY